jgi:hypothetical protein
LSNSLSRWERVTVRAYGDGLKIFSFSSSQSFAPALSSEGEGANYE